MTDKQIEDLKGLAKETLLEANNFIEKFASNPNEKNKQDLKKYVGMLTGLLTMTTKELCERKARGL